MLRSMAIALAFVVSTAAVADTAAVAPATLKERLDAGDPPVLVLDVRTAGEFAAGHVPGAVNIAYDQLAARIAEIDAARDTDIVVYCRSGRRAGIAIEVLEEAGFKSLSQLEGDFPAWSAAGLPVETAEEPPPAM